MSHLIRLLILTTTLWTVLETNVYAQDLEIPVYRLPEGRQVGEERCYSLGDFQELLRIDTDLHAAQETIARLEEAAGVRDRVIMNLTQAHELANAQVELLQQERTRLRQRWEEENRLRYEAEASPDVLGWVGWAAAAVAVVTAVALGITLAVSN